MSNLILGINTDFAYYFNEYYQHEVDTELAKAPYNSAVFPAKLLAQEWNGSKKFIVDLVSIAKNLTLRNNHFDTNTGLLTLEFTYNGLRASKLHRIPFDIDPKILKPTVITTSALIIEEVQGGAIPDSDSAIHITSVSQSDDVPGKGKPD